jgi:hypothetical protein
MGNKPAVSNTPAATQQASVTSEQDEFAKDEADELRTSIPAPPPPPTNQVSLVCSLPRSTAPCHSFVGHSLPLLGGFFQPRLTVDLFFVR